MDSLDQIPLKTIFLRSLIVSVGISAALGISVILVGDFGKFETKVLLTTLTLSAASLCGLCCGAAIEIRGKHGIPVSGILLSALAAVTVISGIWIEPNSEWFWKTTATASIFAVSFSHLSLLQLARLIKSYAWVMPAAHLAVFSVAALLTGLLWDGLRGDFVFRLLGVAAVLDAAITLLVPIFHRLGQDEHGHGDDRTLLDLDREITQLEKRLCELKAMKQAAERKQTPASVSQ